MITKYIWTNCLLLDGKNAFLVGCTDEEVVKHILPRKIGNNSKFLKSVKHNHGEDKYSEDKTESIFNNFFLISSSGNDIINSHWAAPYSIHLNEDKAFLKIEKFTFDNIDELKELERKLIKEAIIIN